MSRASRDPTTELILSVVGSRSYVPAGVDWSRAATLLELHGLGPLACAMDRASGTSFLPADLSAHLEPEYRRTALRSTLILESVERARTALAEAGIASLVFKGAALVASGVYRDPGARPMDDADLLVRPAAARASVDALERAGFVPWTPWTSGRDHWLDSISLADGSAPRGVPVALDLHWRTEYGDLRFGDPGGGSILWDGADEELGVPRDEAHLQLVAEHVLKHLRHQIHFPGLADLCRLVDRVRDWETVAALAATRKTAPAVGLLLDLVRSDVDAPVPEVLVKRLGGRGVWVGGARRWLTLARLVGRVSPVDNRVSGLLLRAILTGSPGRATGDLAHTAFPSTRWLEARYGGGGSRLRLWLRYARDSVRWVSERGASPASPNQDL